MYNEKQKTVPELRFPEFESDRNWEVKKLENICDVNPTNKELPEEFVYVDLESVEKGRLLKRNIINLKDAPSRAQRLLKKEDVIYQMVRPYQKNNFYFDIEDDFEYVASTGYALLRAFKSKMFLYQYLHTTDFVNRVLAKCTGSNYPAINSKDLSKIKVTVPLNPKEQQKIANCLSSLDEVITAETEKLDLLQDHKKGLLQQLFPAEGETQPKFRFPEFENDGDWEQKEVREIFEVTRGYVLSMSLVSEKQTVEKHYPVYSSQTKNNGLAGFYNEYLYENAITWTTDGANAGDVNYREGKFYCTNVCGVLLSDKGFANRCIAEIINSVAKKHVSYIGNPKLMNGVMGKISISVPPLKEQQKIAKCLTNIDELIEAQALKIKTLKKHKKGLMQKLFPKANSLTI